jgi:lysozyme
VALKTPAKGVDVSTWQHPNGEAIDWEEVAKAGYTFAIVKATQGNTWVNPWLARDLDDARAQGLLVGAYHFYQWGTDAKDQASFALSHLAGQVLELGFYLDWEVESVPQWELGSTYTAFLDESMAVRNPTGTYCDLSWHTQLVAANVPIYRLWLADYNESEPVPSFLWQDSETGTVPGIPGTVDLDYLNSTRGLNIPTAPVEKKVDPVAVKAAIEADAVPEDEEPVHPAGVGEHNDL